MMPDPTTQAEGAPVAEPEFVPEQPETDTLAAAEGGLPAAAEPAVSPAEHYARRCAELASEIRLSRRLPRGLRERLAAAVESTPATAAGGGVPVMPVADAVALFEDSLPPQMALAAESLARSEHPAGETFFSGDARRPSREESARIAAEQLAATGFARR